MAKPKTKLVLRLEGAELAATIANAGYFTDCDGLDNILLPFRSKPDWRKLALTESNYFCMYQGVLSALDGVKYPGKSGHEYESLLRVKELMETEFERQRGEALAAAVASS